MRAYFKFGTTIKDSEIIKSSYSLKQNYFNNLISADNSCKFSIPFNQTIADLIKGSINSDIVSYILDDSNNYIFKGYLKKSANFEKDTNVKNIGIEIVSPSYFLDKNFEEPYSTASMTLKNAVKYVLEKAGINTYNINALPNKTISVFSVSEDDTYKDLLNTLLGEYGFTFDFNNSGVFTVIPVFDDPGTVTQTFIDGAAGNIIGELSQNVEEKEYDGVSASYNNLVYAENKTIFLDESEHEISAGGYLYDNTSGAYCEYDSEIGEVKHVSSVTSWTVQFSSFKLTNKAPNYGSFSATLENCGTRALLVVHNGGSYSAKVTKVEIIGQGYFVKSSEIAKTTEGTKFNDVELRFITDKTEALNYAQKLTNYYKNANFKVDLKSKINYAYGSFVTVTASKMGTVTGRITQKTYRIDSELIQYEIEACKNYSTIGVSLQTVKKNNTLTTSAVNGINKEVIAQVASSTQMHYLATSLNVGVTVDTEGWTDLPQAINSVDRYLWTYQSISYTTGGETSVSNSTPVISGVYGEKGVTGSARILSNLYESGTNNEVGIYRGSVYVYLDGVWNLANNEGYLGVSSTLPELKDGSYFLCSQNFIQTLAIKAGSGILSTKDGKVVTARQQFYKGFIYLGDSTGWKKLPKSDYRYTVIMTDSYNVTGAIPEVIENVMKDVSEGTLADRVGTYQGKTYADIENPVIGDFYLYEERTPYEGRKSGFIYKYNGENWVELDPMDPGSYSFYMQALTDSLKINGAPTGAFSTLFANFLMTNQAVINNLQTSVIKLSTRTEGSVTRKGVIYGGNRYNADGSDNDTSAKGFYQDTDGTFKTNKADIENLKVTGGNFNNVETTNLIVKNGVLFGTTLASQGTMAQAKAAVFNYFNNIKKRDNVINCYNSAGFFRASSLKIEFCINSTELVWRKSGSLSTVNFRGLGTINNKYLFGKCVCYYLQFDVNSDYAKIQYYTESGIETHAFDADDTYTIQVSI